jgi:putative membrane protein
MLIFLLVVFIWSAIDPVNKRLWFYEVSFAVILVITLIFTHRRFPLTTLTYAIIFIGTLIMLIGGHYTYNEVPLFCDFVHAMHLKRNPFDRFGHFFQGVVSTTFFRELMIRKKVICKNKWLPFLIMSISLAIAAFYEIFEFFIPYLKKENISEFLGEQGDRWDSHWDMVNALLGSILFLVLFGHWHAKQIKRIDSKAKKS